MFSLVWDYMAQKIDIRENIHNQSIKKKEQKKIRYNKKVKMQYFKPGNLYFLETQPHTLENLQRDGKDLFSLTALVGIMASYIHIKYQMKNPLLIYIIVITYGFFAYQKDIYA